MEIVTSAQMMDIERMAVESQKVPLIELMEAAGKSVADLSSSLAGPKSEIAVYCGKGNNGGDGLVAARFLKKAGHDVTVYLCFPKEEFKGIAKEALENAKADLVNITDFKKESCPSPDLVIDALFGFNLKGEIRGSAADAVSQINKVKAIVVSVDVPSGVDADTGKIDGSVVRADHTVTFTCPKIGTVINPGAGMSGRIHLVDIGISKEIVTDKTDTYLASRKIVASLIPRRKTDASKHSCGRVLVIAGSVGMTGAAAMTSMAALRTGAGIVTLAAPESLNDILEIKLTEVMTIPLPETSEQTFSMAAFLRIKSIVKKFDVIAIGPGISRNEETKVFLNKVVSEIEIPMVIDADGLNCLESLDILSINSTPKVITPHEGELSRLLDEPISKIRLDRVKACREASRILKTTVVLKGDRSIISGHGATTINATGNAGMATAGTGDVLTGVIAALMAQGLPDYPASVAGTFLHGLSGDLGKKEKGELALIAGDLVDLLPKAIKNILAVADN